MPKKTPSYPKPILIQDPSKPPPKKKKATKKKQPVDAPASPPAQAEPGNGFCSLTDNDLDSILRIPAAEAPAVREDEDDEVPEYLL